MRLAPISKQVCGHFAPTTPDRLGCKIVEDPVRRLGWSRNRHSNWLFSWLGLAPGVMFLESPSGCRNPTFLVLSPAIRFGTRLGPRILGFGVGQQFWRAGLSWFVGLADPRQGKPGGQYLTMMGYPLCLGRVRVHNLIISRLGSSTSHFGWMGRVLGSKSWADWPSAGYVFNLFNT
jgi:hypothetical protein